jgi:hypothetical protein
VLYPSDLKSQVEDDLIEALPRACAQEETFLAEVAGPETPQRSTTTKDVERQASCPALAAATVHESFSQSVVQPL